MKYKCYACKKELPMSQLNFYSFTPFYIDASYDYPDLLCDKCLVILNNKYRDTAQSIEDYSESALEKLRNQWIGDCNVSNRKR